MRRALILPAAIVVLGGPFVAGYLLSRPDRATTPVALPSLVDEVREALAGRYARPASAGVLRLDAVNAMLSALRDPYTAYLTPLSYRLVRHDTAASYSAIGVEVLPTERGLVVVAVPPGPAARAGVQRGDVIVEIGGRTVVGLGASKAPPRVVGSPRRPVRPLLDPEGAIGRPRVPRRLRPAP